MSVLQQDRRKEFEEVALPHLGVVYSFALRLSRNEQDARDIAQETFLKAYRFFDTFETGTNIKAWLLKICKNTFFNHYRKRSKGPRRVDFNKVEKFLDTERFGMGETTPEHAFDGTLDDEVTAALGLLPLRYRTAVSLVDLEELPYHEAAQVIGCPVGTVRSRLFRGRRILAKLLRDYAEERGYVATKTG